MASFYTVVQYVPDPVTDERLNVGIIAFDSGVIRSRFLRRWRRVQQFGAESIAFLKEFAQQVGQSSRSEVPLPGLGTTVALDADAIRAISGRWMNSIQFTEPKASLLAPDELLAETAPRFLREVAPRRRGFRDRRAAASLATSRVAAALEERVGEASRDLLRKNVKLQGEFDQHQFDVAVQNGRVFFAAHGLSFEGPLTRDLEKEIDATAWGVDDVKRQQPRLPLAIVALPPRTQSKTYERASRVFEGLRADVVDENQVDEWAQRMAAAVG
jgi:hypothetical protein